MNSGKLKGAVTRVFTTDKFGSIKLEIPPSGNSKYPDRVELVGFGRTVESIKAIGQGQEVEVEFSVGSKKLTSKDGEAVQVDGYNVYVPQLKVIAIRAIVATNFDDNPAF